MAALLFRLDLLSSRAQNRACHLLAAVGASSSLLLPLALRIWFETGNKGVSSTTRALLADASANTLLSRPWELSFASHLAYGHDWLAATVVRNWETVSPSALREVSDLFWSDTDRSLVPKDLPSTLIWYCGLTAVPMVYALYRSILLSASSRRRVAVATYLVIGSIAYVNMLYVYLAAITIGALVASSAPRRPEEWEAHERQPSELLVPPTAHATGKPPHIR